MPSFPPDEEAFGDDMEKGEIEGDDAHRDVIEDSNKGRGRGTKEEDEDSNDGIYKEGRGKKRKRKKKEDDDGMAELDELLGAEEAKKDKKDRKDKSKKKKKKKSRDPDSPPVQHGQDDGDKTMEVRASY